MISTDRKIFDPESAVHKRMLEYSTLFDELHIIIFSLQKLEAKNPSDQVIRAGYQLGAKCWAYPTNSANRPGYVLDACKIGKRILSDIFFGQTVITTQDPFETGLVGWLLKRFSKSPLQMQIHTDLFSPYFFQSSPLNAIRVLMARFLLHRADRIRVVRKKIAEDLVSKSKISADKIQVLPILWEKFPSLFVPLSSRVVDGKKNILMVSRLEGEKKVDLGLKVFAKASKGREDVRLVIVGDGSLRNKLQKMAKKLGVLEKVSFEGWREDVADFYKNAYIFLNTSEYEGFGMSLFESAYSGCAIVTTDVGIAQDVLDNGRSALVCPVGDENCLYTKILNVLENPTVAQGLSESAKEDVQEEILSKEDYLKKYREGMDNLLSK